MVNLKEIKIKTLPESRRIADMSSDERLRRLGGAIEIYGHSTCVLREALDAYDNGVRHPFYELPLSVRKG